MKKHLITGLAILLPLVVTIAVIFFLVHLFTDPFVDAVSSLLSHVDFGKEGFLFLSSEQVIRYTSQLLILIALFAFTIALGIVARWLFINAFFRVFDKLLRRVPVVNTVYKTTHEIIKTLFVSNKNSFRQVVMAPFPRPDVYVLGLISRESPTTCREAADEELISVFVPTTPNPTTGFLMMFKKEDLIYIEMKPEDAIKYIISCGVILPEDPKHATTS